MRHGRQKDLLGSSGGGWMKNGTQVEEEESRWVLGSVGHLI